MTFTHARYAFTLKTPARVHSARNGVAHFVTSVRQLRGRQAVRSSHVGSSRNRETRHFRPEDSTTALFSQERGIFRGRYPVDRLHVRIPRRDTISLRFLRGSLLRARREICERDYERERTKVASLLGPAIPSWFTTLITRGTTSR